MRPVVVPLCLAVAVAALCCAGPPRSAAPAPPPFRIRVVDAPTGRGIPLVELETVDAGLWVTDSSGIAAIDEPGLRGQQVFFQLRSHGYDFPKDGFGYRGVRVLVEPGATATVEMRRVNVAERLYRVTGRGIYRDSTLCGDPVPTRAPNLCGGVLGQDSVVNALFGDRLLWFWGDTNRAAYPLGNFAVAGAVSALPGAGGLDPSVGVDLDYFVGDDGFCRKMCPIDGPGPVWIDGLMVVEAELLCHYARMKDLGTRYEHGIARWDAGTERFEKLRELPLDVPLHPAGHPIRVAQGGEEWFYFPNPYPCVRVRARIADIVDPDRYEAFTCLRAGARFDAGDPPLDRGPDGALAWGWKAATSPVLPQQWGELVKSGRVDGDDSPFDLRDVETGARVLGHGGSISWNAHRRKWVMIALEVFGKSMLGEVWYCEADGLLGPWVWARRIVTHDQYSFYNVKEHPYFAQQDGRLVYFEGTYTATFSGNAKRTPRYDYNQIMYRLDLDDPRLVLPGPVYQVEVDGRAQWLGGTEVEQRGLWPVARAVPFCALPSEPGTGLGAIEGAVPLYAVLVAQDGGAGARGLSTERHSDDDAPVCWALHAAAAESGPTVPVYGWFHLESGRLEYRAAGDAPADEGWRRAAAPVFRAWPSANARPPLLPDARYLAP